MPIERICIFMQIIFVPINIYVGAAAEVGISRTVSGPVPAATLPGTNSRLPRLPDRNTRRAAAHRTAIDSAGLSFGTYAGGRAHWQNANLCLPLTGSNFSFTLFFFQCSFVSNDCVFTRNLVPIASRLVLCL